jgi:hypothetical protein
MNDAKDKMPLWAFIVEKLMFCESGTWLERILVALAMAIAGTLLVFWIYFATGPPPGGLRGLLACFCYTVSMR